MTVGAGWGHDGSGRIAERGTHAQLLEKKGVYASMWNRQREADEARNKLKKAESAEMIEAERERTDWPTRLAKVYSP